MAIKHSVIKSPGDKGYAKEWNSNHIVDGDIDVAGYRIINLGNPSANTDASPKQYVDDDSNKCRLFRSSVQNILSGPFFNDISFDTEIYDPANMFDLATPTDIHIHKSGVYLIIGYLIGTAPSSVSGSVELQVAATNTSHSDPFSEDSFYLPSPNELFSMRCCVILGLTNSSVVSLRVMNNTGGTIPAKASITIYKLRP